MNQHASPPRGHALADLPPELAARVQAELRDGEFPVWVGQPRPDLYAKASGCVAVFGIVFTIFAALWMIVPLGLGVMLLGLDEDLTVAGVPLILFGLMGLPFILVGIGLLTLPVWNRRFARKVCYVLTDRRALSWEPQLFGGMTVRSYQREGLGKITRHENPDGSGSLVFHEYTVRDSDGSTTHRQGFLCIDDVRFVEELVRRTLLA